MSTLQHTSQLRVHATRRLVLLVVIALVAAAGAAAAIVAITTGGSSTHSRSAVAQPVYAGGALERQLAPLRQARVQAASERGRSSYAPSPQTSGQRP